MKKIYDQTFKKGAVTDDNLYEHMRLLNDHTHKPDESESDLVDGNIGDFSYSTIVDKKFRIVVYLDD